MEIKTLYKVFSGETGEVEHVLNTLSRDGWRPVTMSCRLNLLTVILENKVMEEAKLNLSTALAEGIPCENTIEDVQ
jgi:hypothetical protein